MIHVIASIGVKPGRRADFLELFRKNLPDIRAENGCIEYIPAVDTDSGIDAQQRDGNVVMVIEKWETLDALHAHLKAPHMEAYRAATADLVEHVSLKVLENA